MADGSAISSSNISNSNGLDRHPKFIQKPEILTPEASSNKVGHQVGVTLTEAWRVNKILFDDDRRRGGNNLSKGAIPGRCDVGRASRVVTGCDIKGKAQLKAKLFSTSPKDSTSLGIRMDLLEQGRNMFDLLSKIGMLNAKALVLGRSKEGSS